MSEVIAQVEKFIQRYYDLELIISPDTIKITIDQERKLTDWLTDAIVNYVKSKGVNEQTKNAKAEECLFWISKALAAGLVHSGTELIRKLDEYKKKNADLEKDLAICIANYTASQREHDRLLRLLDQNQNLDEKTSEDNEQP